MHSTNKRRLRTPTPTPPPPPPPVNYPPQITDAPEAITLAENTEEDFEVGTVSARDSDSGTPTISINSTHFKASALSSNGGTATLSTTDIPLDFETSPTFDITVSAYAGGRTARRTIPVTLTDVEETETVTLTTSDPTNSDPTLKAPITGQTITATLNGDTTNNPPSWTWESSSNEVTWDRHNWSRLRHLHSNQRTRRLSRPRRGKLRRCSRRQRANCQRPDSQSRTGPLRPHTEIPKDLSRKHPPFHPGLRDLPRRNRSIPKHR